MTNAMNNWPTVADELNRTLSAVDPAEVEALVEAILSAKRIFAAGAGRSGLAIRGFAMRLAHLGLSAFVVGETTTPSYAAGDLLVIGSGSGGTGSLVAMATKARKIGGTVALITVLADSPIGRLADLTTTIPAVTPKSDAETSATSIQPMGALFEQSLFILFDLVVLRLMERLGLDSAAMFERHANLE